MSERFQEIRERLGIPGYLLSDLSCCCLLLLMPPVCPLASLSRITGQDWDEWNTGVGDGTQ